MDRDKLKQKIKLEIWSGLNSVAEKTESIMELVDEYTQQSDKSKFQLSIIDALCIIKSGWVTAEEQELYQIAEAKITSSYKNVMNEYRVFKFKN